ncbi:hypothetical protein SRS16P3_00230 (plasmid) [Variovorax sp. SRS16]|uniref:hypothetical protein n=1 Tax=Variovorax sp. SRS16 TaxID=282217 RepID=UPI001316D89F|nr:hypothetical protein [Variovorax sp. SRS16]VTU46518.1 hypothetical protein SRS16P3_00230 [Variovorax sp. SRS16]
MTTPDSTDHTTIHVSVREARMAVERILMTCGLPKGYVPAVRECILLSQSLGLAGFDGIRDAHDALTGARLERMAIVEEAGSALTLDAGQLHAWLVLPTMVDLAVDLARRRAGATVRVENALQPDELRIATALVSRYGAVASFGSDGTHGVVEVRNAARPRSIQEWDPRLQAALRDGYSFEKSRWREIYALSNRALAPDSVTSRRHAGPVLVDAQGRIVGRAPVDDETDLRTLTCVN